jgi:uncharacterized protein YndB with AHSA1/START domain
MTNTATTPDLAIDLDVLIEAPVARVWSFVATADGMRRWMGATRFEPRVGGEALFHYNFTTLSQAPEDAEYRMSGHVVAFEPIRRIAYTWRQEDLVGGMTWPADTLVTIELRGEGRDDTRVRVRHSGFEALGPELGRAAYDDYRQGWEAHDDLGRLKRLAEDVATA